MAWNKFILPLSQRREVWYKDVSKTSLPPENPGKIPFLVPWQLLLIPGILRLVAPSVPSLCLLRSAPQPVSLFVSHLESLWWWVGPSQVTQPGLFIFKIINYLNLLMGYAKIFFLQILSSLSNPLFQLWFLYPYLVFCRDKIPTNIS